MTEILQIVEIPNPILAEKSKPVQVVDDNVRKIMDSMLATMYKCNGVGLAAVQVGILKRIVVIDIGDDPNNNVKMPLYMVNPEIISSSDEKNEFEEGCLSVPEARYKVDRPKVVTVRFLDYNGVPQEITASGGILSVCLQHEIDHLNGILFIDHLSKLKKDMTIKKSLKSKKYNHIVS